MLRRGFGKIHLEPGESDDEAHQYANGDTEKEGVGVAQRRLELPIQDLVELREEVEESATAARLHDIPFEGVRFGRFHERVDLLSQLFVLVAPAIRLRDSGHFTPTFVFFSWNHLRGRQRAMHMKTETASAS